MDILTGGAILLGILGLVGCLIAIFSDWGYSEV